MRLIFTLLDLPPLNQFDAAAALPLDGFGDRLDLEPGTGHAATVGPGGCRCVEASR